MPTLDIQLFGDFSLRYDEGLVTTVSSSRLQSLLAYLLLNRHAPQSRQYLAFLFWPDTDEKQARTNLRNLLYQLRRALPRADQFLHVGPKTIQWRFNSPFKLDVAHFEDAIHQAQAAISPLRNVQTALEQAVELYPGDLLPKFYEEWIVAERGRLHSLYHNALEQLIVLLSEQQKYTAAIDYAERLLRHDRLREETYRLLIRLHALNDDRASALHTYHGCATVLRRELEVEPSPATVVLVERLVRKETLPEVSKTPTENVLGYGASILPLVGRQAEWRQLEATWGRAEGGRPHFLLIMGEAGIGKTRLAEELVTWVDRQGITYAVARCYNGEDSLSYAPAVAWLRSTPFRPQLPGVDDIWLIELSRLLPELHTTRPDLPEPKPLTQGWQRQRLFEALARALLVIKQPILLILDDIQWCDPETLEWLHFLLHFELRAQLLIVGTMRMEEVNPDHPLMAWRFELKHRRQLTEIELGPLTEVETIALGAEVAGGELGQSLAKDLVRETEGHPLFIVETVRAGHWHTPGRSKTVAQGELPAAYLPPAGTLQTHRSLPPTIQNVIESRLNQLSPSTRELIGLAAVIGREFTIDILAEASSADETTLVNALDEAWQRRIVREQGAKAYDFSHDRIREVAYASLSSARRRLLHRSVAGALQKIHFEHLDTVSAELASHFEQADMVEEAIIFHQKAAEAALYIYANPIAIHHLTRGLVLLQTLPATPERAKHELVLQSALGGPILATRGMGAPELGRAYSRVRELCKELDQSSDYLPFLWGQMAYLNTRAELDEARALGEHLLELAQHDNDPARVVMACRGLGPALSHLGELTLAQQQLARAVAIYDPEQHHALALHFGADPGAICLSFGMINLWVLGYADQALAWSQRARELAQALAHPYSRGFAHVFTAWLHVFRREASAAAQAAETALVLSAEREFAQMLAMAKIFQGWATAQLGRSSQGIQQLREGLEAWRVTGAEVGRPHWLAMLGEQCLRAGRVAEVEECLTEGLALVEKSGERRGEAELYRLKGELLLQQNGTEAENNFLQAIDIARRQGALAWELRAALSLSRLWQIQGRQTEARRLLTHVYSRFSEGFGTPDLQEAQTLLNDLS